MTGRDEHDGDVTQMVVAMCENCGAALRISEGATSVVCEYCGVTAISRSVGGNAPTLRIVQAPIQSAVNVEDQTKGWALVIVGGAIPALIGLGALVAGVDWVVKNNLIAGLLVPPFFLLGGLGILHTTRKQKAIDRERQWLRDHGDPGRATVEKIQAGSTHWATLGVKVEVTGYDPWYVEHRTKVPALLVPQLVRGLHLPVLVHPDDPEDIALQWHLV